MRALRTLLSIAILFATACYSYAPTALEQAPPGAKVRVRLSPEEAERVRVALPATRRTLTGTVMATGEELLIQVPIATAAPATAAGTLHQQIRLPRQEVLELELRQLDRTRTTLLILGGTTVVGLLIANQFSGGAHADQPLDPGGPGDATRLPTRIPLQLWLRSQ